MTDSDSSPPVGAEPMSRPWGALVVAAVCLVAAAVLLVRTTTVAATDGSAGAHEQMIAVSPGGYVDIETLPAELQDLYHAAAADVEAFSAVACYCGCERMLGHRHLLDCFVRPDGGWERHAVGCGICQLEARDIIVARAAGTPLDRIVADIDVTYGSITAPQENGT